ncbi:MAG TPA: hypothetical protein VIP09_08815 [Dehalococcoidia bacterium]
MNDRVPRLAAGVTLAVLAASVIFVVAPAIADKGGCPNAAAANGAAHGNSNSAFGREKQAARGCTNEASPTSTPAPTPAAVVTPANTETSRPSKTPESSETPEATETPEPSETPEATEAPEPSDRPELTAAPEPSEVPEATDVPDSNDGNSRDATGRGALRNNAHGHDGD